jgi:hypothetical protein
MEVGQGPNWGCSAKEKKKHSGLYHATVNLFQFYSKLFSLNFFLYYVHKPYGISTQYCHVRTACLYALLVSSNLILYSYVSQIISSG